MFVSERNKPANRANGKANTKILAHKFLSGLRSGSVLTRAGVYLFLCDLAFVFLFPFFYMLVTSVKSSMDLQDLTVNWIPNTIMLSNFKDAFQLLNYPVHAVNSGIVTIVSTLGHLISCSFVGYGLARFRFKGRSLVFALVIFTIIVPVQVIIIPQYIMFINLYWTNTFLPIVLPTFLGIGLRGGLFIFIFRQFFQGLPPALEDAAKIDGCGYIKTFFSIVLPVAKPSIVVTCILSIVWHWNEYFEASIYLGRPNIMPLPSMLPAVYEAYKKLSVPLTGAANSVTVTEGTVMAATFLVVLPLLILFLFVQRQFVEGVERTGIVE